MNTADFIIFPIQISVIAYVYAVLLIEPEMLLGWVYGKLTQLAVDKPWTEFFLKPIMLCAPCVAGQMALWTLVLYGHFHLLWVKTVIDVSFFIAITILLLTVLIKKLHE